MPVELVLADGAVVRCTKMLRLLPGKRAVMQGRWQGQSVLIKLMPDTASGRRNARRETTGHRLLRDAGIDTPDLLFAARSEDRGHVLGFAFVHDAQPLGALWRERAERRAGIAAAALELLARLHRRGCRHADPHLDNFLL
ncbi:MAG: hypothetical protein ACR2P7_10370, partial [bacterium]